MRLDEEYEGVIRSQIARGFTQIAIGYHQEFSVDITRLAERKIKRVLDARDRKILSEFESVSLNQFDQEVFNAARDREMGSSPEISIDVITSQHEHYWITSKQKFLDHIKTRPKISDNLFGISYTIPANYVSFLSSLLEKRDSLIQRLLQKHIPTIEIRNEPFRSSYREFFSMAQHLEIYDRMWISLVSLTREISKVTGTGDSILQILYERIKPFLKGLGEKEAEVIWGN